VPGWLEIVREAELLAVGLAREGEARELACVVVGIEDDEVVALGAAELEGVQEG
jgi:hypothetical protein